jgi:hypothetical protein
MREHGKRSMSSAVRKADFASTVVNPSIKSNISGLDLITLRKLTSSTSNAGTVEKLGEKFGELIDPLQEEYRRCLRTRA